MFFQTKKFAVGIILCMLFAFLGFGYLFSDNIFYKEFIQANNLSTPYDAYCLIIANYTRQNGKEVHSNASPKHLMETHKSFWCDEGAIVIATLAHELGYKTRLVDLYGLDNISHHTVLQVMEREKWITYDFTFRLHNKSLVTSANKCNFFLKVAKVKKYPKAYNFLVNNNSFLKKGIFYIRGIDETH